MGEITKDDWHEACAIFNRSSRIYYFAMGEVLPKETAQASLISQTCREVEAACAAILWKHDPEMKRFKIEPGETLEGTEILRKIDEKVPNMARVVVTALESKLDQVGLWQAENSEDSRMITHMAADLMLVLAKLPEQGPLEKFEDEFPLATSFIAYHEFELDKINERRERERTLCERTDGGRWTLTDSFWERAMICLRVERSLFDEISWAEETRRRTKKEFTPPPAP